MKKIDFNILEKDLVLLGAGHSNIEVLRNFSLKPIKGIRITLITNRLESPYSGMVPGYIEGVYKWSDIIIDLVQMSFHYDFRLICSEVTKIDGLNNKIFLKNREPLGYDYLSINTGINSKDIISTGQKKLTLPLKPISGINSLVSKTILIQKKNPANKLVLIGAGAAGVEVALAFRMKFNDLGIKNQIIIISNKKFILEKYNYRVRKVCENALKKNKIKVIYNKKVTKITENYVELDNKKKIYCSFPLLSTSSQPPSFIKKSNLSKTASGYLAIYGTLQIKNFKNIFASGDVSEISNVSNIKAGVFAVKQGIVLSKNLRNFINNKNLESYYPQKFYLSLIGLGKKRALANKYFLTFQGSIFWKLKEFIDRKFIKKYSFSIKKNSSEKPNFLEPYDNDMQCEGCGNKIPQNVLKNVFNEKIDVGSPDAEKVPVTSNLFHTVDVISSIVKDPYLLGRIAAKHAINDLFAINSNPISAQMIVGLPPAKNIINERDLFQLKKGSQSIFNEANCKLSGGHSFSFNGDQIIVGFSLIGQKRKLMSSKKFSEGKIYITGYIGSALVVAGIKEKKIAGIYYKNVLASMIASNYRLHKILSRNNIMIKTDISGFGLAIHLHNLFLRNNFLKGAEIYLDNIPLFKGAKLALQRSVASSLSESNKNFISKYLEIKNTNNKLVNSIYDPQTAGGFIFICRDNEQQAIKELKENNIKCTHIGNIIKNKKRITII